LHAQCAALADRPEVWTNKEGFGVEGLRCRELTTLWVARLDDGAELKVTDPEEQQGDVEEEEAEG